MNKLPKRKSLCHFHVVANRLNDTAIGTCTPVQNILTYGLLKTKLQISLLFMYLNL